MSDPAQPRTALLLVDLQEATLVQTIADWAASLGAPTSAACLRAVPSCVRYATDAGQPATRAGA